MDTFKTFDIRLREAQTKVSEFKLEQIKSKIQTPTATMSREAQGARGMVQT